MGKCTSIQASYRKVCEVVDTNTVYRIDLST
jgi:hypothetical protein